VAIAGMQLSARRDKAKVSQIFQYTLVVLLPMLKLMVMIFSSYEKVKSVQRSSNCCFSNIFRVFFISSSELR
jgi:hypothetical protein